MKYLKRLKKLIRLSFCLILIFILIFTLSVSAFATPPSIFPSDDDKEGYYLFTPFNMRVLGDVDIIGNTEIVSHPYNFTIPDIFLYSEDRSDFYSFSTASYMFDDVVSSVGFTLSFDSPIYSTADLSGSTGWSTARFTLALTNTYDSSLSSSNVVNFQNCYLDPEISLKTGQIGSTGISFRAEDPDYRWPPGVPLDSNDTVLAGLVYGQFYLPGHPRTFSTSYEGGYLSYYKALVYSNIDFTLFYGSFEENFTSEELYAAIEEFKTYDFLRLTSAQLEELEYYFGWVGPLYGSFELTLPFDTTLYGSSERKFCFRYSLVDRDILEKFYETNVDRSTYSGLTGFERVTRFLGTATSGFLSFEIAPNFTFAGIFLVIITFSLVMWWLKVFAGG